MIMFLLFSPVSTDVENKSQILNRNYLINLNYNNFPSMKNDITRKPTKLIEVLCTYIIISICFCFFTKRYKAVRIIFEEVAFLKLNLVNKWYSYSISKIYMKLIQSYFHFRAYNWDEYINLAKLYKKFEIWKGILVSISNGQWYSDSDYT